MYDISFDCENIFLNSNMYKIHCIGKCEEVTHPYKSTTVYYLFCHGKKYEAVETCNGLDDLTVELSEVDNFNLPEGNRFQYYTFTDEIEYGIKYDMFKEFEDKTYFKDGIFIFKEMHVHKKGVTLAGIDSIYKLEHTTFSGLKECLNAEKYAKR